MKKNYPILLPTLLFFILANVAEAQTVRRVNNNDGITGTNVYTTIQAAHDAAVNGDIILVEPSTSQYGDLNCSKSLKIYGNGYWLDMNGTNIKANNLSSKLGSVYFIPGSSGAEISGCETMQIRVYAVSNIKINRNKSLIYFGSYYNYYISINALYTPTGGQTQYANVNNITISENFGYQISISGSSFSNTDYTINNVSVSNNALGGLYALDIKNYIAGVSVKHNTITSSSIKLENSVFENNIIVSNSTGAFDTTEPLNGEFTAKNSSLNYNVASANIFPVGVGTGNQNSINLSLHFVAPLSNMSDDFKLKLRDESSLKTAGSGGTEVGMFGGAIPYVISGIPAIPSITNLKTTGTGSNTVPITVTFSAKSNN